MIKMLQKRTQHIQLTFGTYSGEYETEEIKPYAYPKTSAHHNTHPSYPRLIQWVAKQRYRRQRLTHRRRLHHEKIL